MSLFFFREKYDMSLLVACYLVQYYWVFGRYMALSNIFWDLVIKDFNLLQQGIRFLTILVAYVPR